MEAHAIRLEGSVSDRLGGGAVAAVLVEAWDAEQKFGEVLATAISDKAGKFVLVFDHALLEKAFADRPHKMATLKLLTAAGAAYEQLASDPDGRVRATLEIVWMSGWAPHESQQKPLKPGSAEISLTKVLGRN